MRKRGGLSRNIQHLCRQGWDTASGRVEGWKTAESFDYLESKGEEWVPTVVVRPDNRKAHKS